MRFLRLAPVVELGGLFLGGSRLALGVLRLRLGLGLGVFGRGLGGVLVLGTVVEEGVVSCVCGDRWWKTGEERGGNERKRESGKKWEEMGRNGKKLEKGKVGGELHMEEKEMTDDMAELS